MDNKFSFRIGGIHPADRKLSSQCAIEVLPLPEKVSVSMAQHLGAPAKPVVAAGDRVRTGQVIGEPAGFVSAFVHSPVTGTVKAVAPRADLAGRMVMHIDIDVEKDEWAAGIDLTPELVTSLPDRQTILDRIKAAGVVGLGGATFPTHIKLCPPAGKKAEFLILNGAECEPYLTSDCRVMLERPREILIGAALMQKALDGPKCVVAVEDNKPEAIEALKDALHFLQLFSKDYVNIEIKVLKKKYPQGSEKQLIDAVTGRQVKSMGLPIDAGAVVQNVTTSFSVYEAVQKNKPLLTNVLSVTGDCLPPERQHNYLFRIGIPLRYIAQVAGGVPEEAVKVVSGGPMMGKAVANLDATTVKGSSSLLFLSANQTLRREEGPCIRCAKCAQACPMGLEPFLLKRLADVGDLQALEKNAVQDCLECGCCQYSCPAYLRLLDTIRIAKADVLNLIKSRPKN